MGAPGYSCGPNVILKAAACYLEPNIGEAEREGIEICARVANLAASGGASLSTISQLLKAMTGLAGQDSWRIFRCNQRQAISTYRAVQDAIADGASLPKTVSELKKAAACYIQMDKEDRKNALAFLSCAISTLGKPD